MSSQNFRTRDEMQAVYETPEMQLENSRPYVIALHRPDRYFGFLGVSHVSNPDHSQWARLFEEWEVFLASTNMRKIVFNEGNGRASSGETRDEAIVDGGDSGLAAWLAEKSGIEHVSPEPSTEDEIIRLKEKFSEDDIMVYYIGRQIRQWLRKDQEKYPDLEKYIEKHLKFYLDKYKWTTKYDVAIVRKLVEDHMGKPVEQLTNRELEIIDSPHENAVSDLSSRIRDESIFAAISQAWQEGKDVFTVYGSGHAITMEPAIRELLK